MRADGGCRLLVIEAGAAREGPKATPAGEAVSAHGGVVTGVAPIGWWKLRGTGAKRCLLMFSFNLFSSSPSAVLNKTFFFGFKLSFCLVSNVRISWLNMYSCLSYLYMCCNM